MKMALQGIVSFEGIKHWRCSSRHRRRPSLDGDHHVVGVKSRTQELSAKLQSTIRPNHNSNCKEEQQQLRKSVWDCESSLYDSFELLAFSRQLNRALAAEPAPPALINSDHFISGIRSLSMPHYVTSVSTEWQYSPLKVDKEEISLQEEKLNFKVAQNEVEVEVEVEHQLDTRQILKAHNKRLGFALSMQRRLARLFHKKARSLQSEEVAVA